MPVRRATICNISTASARRPCCIKALPRSCNQSISSSALFLSRISSAVSPLPTRSARAESNIARKYGWCATKERAIHSLSVTASPSNSCHSCWNSLKSSSFFSLVSASGSNFFASSYAFICCPICDSTTAARMFASKSSGWSSRNLLGRSGGGSI